MSVRPPASSVTLVGLPHERVGLATEVWPLAFSVLTELGTPVAGR